MPAVTVNLDLNVSAASAITVFGQAASTGFNPIVPSLNLPVSAMNGLIEFWEPKDDTLRGTVYSHLDLTSYKTSSFKLYSGLKSILASNFDCQGAVPYTTDASGNLASYSALAGFGKVALGQVAHAVFGHVAATAAITNDDAFVSNMLLETASTDWDTIKTNGNSTTRSAASPNLANALVRELVMKGYSSDAEITGENNASGLTDIVKQVIGQDQTRARSVDNNEIAPIGHQALTFAAGDIIYMGITVSYPTISLSASTGTITPVYGAGVLGNTQKFDLKITLA